MFLLIGWAAAESVFCQPTNASARGRQERNLNDAYYKLGPDSKPMASVPKARFVGPNILPSKVFPGEQHTYYVYVPAQYDPAKPAAVMVFNDGQAMMAEPGDVQAQNVLDNLIYRREIPVMLGVFINPAAAPTSPNPLPQIGATTPRTAAMSTIRRHEKYARVIVNELMPALKKEYNLSPDPDLHGIMGASSGGCAAFAVAWFRPNDFRKVITFVGSFTEYPRRIHLPRTGCGELEKADPDIHAGWPERQPASGRPKRGLVRIKTSDSCRP